MMSNILSNIEHYKDYRTSLIKEMTQMSPIDYLNYFRITQSARLLCDTDFPISTIAVKTGFNNISYYNRTFRKYMHMTPGSYRKNFRES